MSRQTVELGACANDTPGELVYYFSHHEKLCVVDNKIAAMGGLDACWGRWDTQNHPLADVHPTQFFKALFPGQGENRMNFTNIIDYNNSRIMDFQTVEKYASNALAIQDATRMRESRMSVWSDCSVARHLSDYCWSLCR